MTAPFTPPYATSHRAWLDSHNNPWDVEPDGSLTLRDTLDEADICRPRDEVARLFGPLRPEPPFPVLPAWAYDSLGLVRDSHPLAACHNPHRQTVAEGNRDSLTGHPQLITDPVEARLADLAMDRRHGRLAAARNISAAVVAEILAELANPAWVDDHGDIWDENPDGTLTARGYPAGELENWPRAEVERVWGPLRRAELGLAVTR